MKIYVGNLSLSIEEKQIQKHFEMYGKVNSVNIVKDSYTGRPRGFCFVEMPDNDQGQAAVKGMNGSMLDSRTLIVNEARERSEIYGSPSGSSKGTAGKGTSGYRSSW